MVFLNKNEDSSLEVEEFKDAITRVNEDIIIDNIISQIETFSDVEKLDNRQSLFKYVEDRFTYMMNKYSVDTDKREEVRIVFDGILDTISDFIEKEINIDIEYSDTIDISEKFYYVKSLYEFFLINLNDELVDLMVNYINKNKKQLVELFNSTINSDEKKNLSYVKLRQTIDNEYTPLIYHIEDIINTLDITTNEDIIELMTEGDEDELSNFYVYRSLVENIYVDCSHNANLIDTFKPLLTNNFSLVRQVSLKLIDLLG